MTASGIPVPEAFTTMLTTQVSGLVASLGGWIPAILIGTVSIVVLVGFFRFIAKYIRGALRVR
jgi:hypothetical protein